MLIDSNLSGFLAEIAAIAPMSRRSGPHFRDCPNPTRSSEDHLLSIRRVSPLMWQGILRQFAGIPDATIMASMAMPQGLGHVGGALTGTCPETSVRSVHDLLKSALRNTLAFHYVLEKKELVADGQNPAKFYVTESKIVINLLVPLEEETRGGEMKETSIMLLKTNGENMSENRLSIMLMKTKNIEAGFHYVDEKKRSY